MMNFLSHGKSQLPLSRSTDRSRTFAMSIYFLFSPDYNQISTRNFTIGRFGYTQSRVNIYVGVLSRNLPEVCLFVIFISLLQNEQANLPSRQ